jgi:hypothetical protein
LTTTKARQIYADEVTVLVWENAATMKIATGMGRPGHAAVMGRNDSLPPLVRQGIAERAARRREIKKKQSDLDRLKQDCANKMDQIGDRLKEMEQAKDSGARQGVLQTRDQEMLAAIVAAVGEQERPKIMAVVNSGKSVWDAREQLYPNDFNLGLTCVRIMKKHPQMDDAEYGSKLQALVLTLQAEVDALKTAQANLAEEIAQLQESCDHPEVLKWSYVNPDKYSYISWWPFGPNDSFWEDMRREINSNAAQMLASHPEKARPGQVKTPGGQWGYEPETVVNLPALGAANRYWGLSPCHMWQWFEDFKDNPDNEYNIVSATQNCSGVAVGALVAGGGEAFAPAPKARVYMLPNEVKAWAINLQAELVRLNKNSLVLECQLIPEYRKTLSRGQPRKYPEERTDLWSLDEWKTHTHLKIGVRTGAVGDIDGLLPKYHACDFDGDYLQKFVLLGTIMRKCFQFIDDQGASARGWGAVLLAAQCLNVLRSPAVRSVRAVA